MRTPEKIGIITTILTISVILFLIPKNITFNDSLQFDTYFAVILSGLISLVIGYYFHKKHTPAQKIWNEKRKETMEEMVDLFEQLSRQVRVGTNLFEKAVNTLGYSQQTLQLFMSSNNQAFGKIQQLHSLIFSNTDRNYNYLTNLESRQLKMMADTLVQYLDMQIRRPPNYLHEIEYLENEHVVKHQLSILFNEVDSTKKDFLKYGIFEFRKSDLDPRWENTHRY